MNTVRALAKGTNQGQHERFDTNGGEISPNKDLLKEKTEASSEENFADHRKRFLQFKAQRFLNHGLRPDTPEGIALANGAQLMLMLRAAEITEARLTLSEEER
jgi:hypothetical protein